jgi:septal ring-binding cell division protein DamX/nucleoid DNA-binding protein
MPVSITPILADRLDISEERARSLLQTMLRELRRRAESDTVQLLELGTFRVEDGRLTFEPSPSLARQVNRQYEGLSPERLTPLEAPPEPSLAAPESASGPGADGPDAEPAPAPDSPPQDNASDPDAAPAQAPEPARGSALDSFSIIGLVLAFLFLLGAGWFVLEQTNVWSPRLGPAPDVAQERPAASDTGEVQAPSDQRSPDTAATQAERDTAATQAGGWSIVVASRSTREAAEATAEKYGTSFDSVEVIPGTVDNETWYRVAIGDYDSEAAAERALKKHASRLPEGVWTHQLR